MSTITKQWLQQTIAEYEANRDELPFGLDTNSSIELEAFKLALASLEAEAVGFIARHKETGKFGSYLHPKADWFKNGEYEVLNAYTAPPAPVAVPDEATPENIEILASTYAPRGVTYQWDRDECNAAADSWNACRAAMLLGSEPDFRENAETSTKCWCHTCRPVKISDMRFVVCPDCGNKRCPHANDHRHACTGSNEPGQEGSAYPAAPQLE